MASSKKIGFFWGDEKTTFVEFEKNSPLKVITSPSESRTNVSSPFSSNLTEEVQITASFQKTLQDNRITSGSFYVSLPMKEIVLRSFVIPYVKQEDIQSAIKFEAKKYLPIDIQDLTFVFNATPFTENKVDRLQIIFYAVRKESLARYERIFKQVNAVVSYCEPCVVSLAKVLLFKKEITLTDHLAFLILDKNLGRICFIDKGVPQFIREFPIRGSSPADEIQDSTENLNLKIINEVGNSFDFYSRQFSGDRIERMLVAAQDDVSQDLFNTLEAELKLKLRKIAPIVTMGGDGQSNDMDIIYAMGACVEPPAVLSGLNFLADQTPKSKFDIDIVEFLSLYKEIVIVFLVCLVALIGVNVLFQSQLRVLQQQNKQLSSKQGAHLNEITVTIQAETQQNTDTLTQYKNIRTKSDVVLILLRVASHLPKGALLKNFNITYDQPDSSDPNNPNTTNTTNNAHVIIDMDGDVFREDFSEQIAVVNQIILDFKNDKELSTFISKVNLVSLTRENLNGKQATGFTVHCS